EALQGPLPGGGTQGAGAALPVRARDLWTRRPVRPGRRGGLHQAVRDGRADRRPGPGPALRPRPGEAAPARPQEVDLITGGTVRGKPRPHGKLYSGRFEEGLLPELEHFSSSLEMDVELAAFDVL